jgi:hypothetical protein
VRDLVCNVGKRAEKDMDHDGSRNQSRVSSRARDSECDAVNSQDSSTPALSLLCQIPWMTSGLLKSSHFETQTNEDGESITLPSIKEEKTKVHGGIRCI